MIEVIYYNSPLGPLCIKCEAGAISQISFANKEKNITINEGEVKYEKGKSAIIKKCIKQLDEYFAGERLEFDLQLLQAGTAFQQSVWDALQKIDYGKTLSYLTLSKRLGNVKAIRAVGTANGKNNIAIVVPCHRVIGSNGSLIGYAGDLWRKKWLLEHEAKHANGVQMLF
jgi:methylated-DNA-[protein]-cysteine S-methyltransferase